MRLGLMWGVRFGLHWSLLALGAAYWWTGLAAQALSVLAALLLHEAAHAVVAGQLGLRLVEITLLPFGGAARFEPAVELQPAAEWRVAAAGPLASMAAAAAVFGCMRAGTAAGPLWEHFFQVNVGLAALNLLPALPLDGGRMLRSWLSFASGFLVASERVAALTRALSLAVIGAGACGLLAGAWNVTLLWIGVFLFGGARREAAAAAFIHVRQLARKKDDLADQDSAPVRLIAARVGAPVSAAVRRFVPGRCHIIQLFDEQGRLSGQLAEAEVIDQFFKEGPASPLGPPKRS